MTFFDLLRLMKRHIKLTIGISLAFAIVAVAWSMVTQPAYTATASFVTNGDLALAQGIGGKEASSHSNTEVKVSCATISVSRQISFSASGANSNACIEAANAAMNATMNQCKEANENILTSVSEANFAVSNNPALVRLGLVALLFGLLAAICILVLIDVIRAPIKSPGEAESVCKLPVLGNAPSPEGGERLLANLLFRCGGRPSTIAVVPVGVESTAPVTARELASALERSDVRVKLVKGSPHAKKFQVSVPEDAAIVVSCEPLDAGMGAAYIAHNADATVLCVSEWADSRRQLASAVGELELAEASIAGIAYLPEEKKPREPRRPKDPEGE